MDLAWKSLIAVAAVLVAAVVWRLGLKGLGDLRRQRCLEAPFDGEAGGRRLCSRCAAAERMGGTW